LAPHKSGERGNGVSALDASYILQYVNEIRTLDPDQVLACDVTGSGMLSALDATRILQLTVGLIPELPVAAACHSEFLFLPEPMTVANQTLIQPMVHDDMCSLGAIDYSPLAGDATGQDFRAVLIGDCTANWQPPTAGAAVRQRGAEPSTLVTRLRRSPGGRLRLAIMVRAPRAVQSIEATLAIDSSRLQLVSARAALAARDGLLLFNEPTPGTVALALANPAPIPAGARVALVVEFAPLTSDATRAEVTIQQLAIDE
jgi:hypothetical protein